MLWVASDSHVFHPVKKNSWLACCLRAPEGREETRANSCGPESSKSESEKVPSTDLVEFSPSPSIPTLSPPLNPQFFSHLQRIQSQNSPHRGWPDRDWPPQHIGMHCCSVCLCRSSFHMLKLALKDRLYYLKKKKKKEQIMHPAFW